MEVATIISLITAYGPIVLSIIGSAATAAAALPKGQPGTAWGAIRSLIDVLGANFGNAKNAK